MADAPAWEGTVLEDGGTIRECDRCAASKNDGGTCTRRTCKYPHKCWQHTIRDHGLKLTKSKIPNAGVGVFATRHFAKNELICEYSGEIRGLREYLTASDSDYGLEVTKNGTPVVIDARSTQSSIGRYINTCRRSNRTHRPSHCPQDNNVKWSKHFHTAGAVPTVKFRASKNIKKGQEILVSYTASYWGDAPGGRIVVNAGGTAASGVSGGRGPSAMPPAESKRDTHPTGIGGGGNSHTSTTSSSSSTTSSSTGTSSSSSSSSTSSSSATQSRRLRPRKRRVQDLRRRMVDLRKKKKTKKVWTPAEKRKWWARVGKKYHGKDEAPPKPWEPDI